MPAYGVCLPASGWVQLPGHDPRLPQLVMFRISHFESKLIDGGQGPSLILLPEPRLTQDIHYV